MGYWETIASLEEPIHRYSYEAMQLQVYGSFNSLYAALVSEGFRRNRANAPLEQVIEGVRYRALGEGIFKEHGGAEPERIYEYTLGIYISANGNSKEVDLTPDGGYYEGQIYLQKYIPTPPSTPASITVSPEIVKEGENINISWGSGADATSYRLERSINVGSWIQVYSGSLREYADTAQEDWNTVRYRVRSYNVDGYSSYRTSDVVKVIHFPEMKMKINGVLKTSDKGWVKINGELREVEGIYTKINGVLREVE